MIPDDIKAIGLIWVWFAVVTWGFLFLSACQNSNQAGWN
jgi:hypothetical protein